MTSQQVLPEGTTAIDLHETILKQALITTENIFNVPENTDWSSLPLELRNELLEVIVTTSIPNQKFFTSLDITLELAIDSKFQGDDWNCTNCQARKIDKQRNCPFLDPEEYHEDTFRLDVGGETYRVCPMNLKDNNILQHAFEAKNIREAGSLPESGALGDQPVFYVIASQKLHNKLESHKSKQLAEAHGN